jgi:hypothetical protein
VAGEASVSERWLVRISGQKVPAPLEIDGLGYFSNPSLCGFRIAFWVVSEQEGVSGVIAALEGSVLARRVFHFQVPESDDRFILHHPVWNQECRGASFTQPDGLHAEISVNDG